MTADYSKFDDPTPNQNPNEQDEERSDRSTESGVYSIANCTLADVSTVIGQDILSLPFGYAIGPNKDAKKWNNRIGQFSDLLGRHLLLFEKGTKDGSSILQGELIESGIPRTADNMAALYAIMVDWDTGDTVDAVIETVQKSGYFAVIWTTHSHMKTSTAIREKALSEWCKKRGLEGDLAIHAAAYLAWEKQVQPWLIQSIERVARKLIVGGMHYIVHHAPMPRTRALFLLDRPFVVTDRGSTQGAAIAEWKALYAGFSESLGLAWDKSCTDPSRLMYLPRHDPHADPLQFEIVAVPGRLVPLESIPRIQSGPSEGRNFRRDEHVGEKFVTPGLIAFARDYGDEFLAATWMRQSHPEDLRHDYGEDKIECRCPREACHSPQNGVPLDQDRAFFVTNGDGSSGFTMFCNHAGCVAASSDTNGRHDRLWYLDQLCQQHDIDHARKLLDWCPSHLEAEEKKKGQDANLASLIEALTTDSIPADIDAVLERVVERQLTRTARMSLLQQIAAKVEGGKWTDAAKREWTSRYNEASKRASNRSAGLTINQGPKDPALVLKVLDAWGYDEHCRIMLGRMLAVNEVEPSIFRRPEGGHCVKTEEAAGGLRTFEMDSPAVWAAHATNCMTFWRDTKDGERSVAPFKDAISYIMGQRGAGYLGGPGFPVLERIVGVPIFATDGGLVFTPGYNAATRTILTAAPDAFEPVQPGVIDVQVAEAVWWILESLRDLPFSDDFNGADPLPVRGEFLDPAGFPLPNWSRGYASRLHAIAMVIQLFMRDLIDGRCPFYLIDKPMKGTGAGLLIETMTRVFTGRDPVLRGYRHNPEEFRKALTAALRNSPAYIVWDNVDGAVDNSDLALIATAGCYNDRLLGESSEVEMRVRALMAFTGNTSLSFSKEINRRIVPIRLDANAVDPARERGAGTPFRFKYDPLGGDAGWLAQNRRKLVWSYHTIIQRWLDQGRPMWTGTAPGSFTGWARTIGGVLMASGLDPQGTGFLSNVSSYLQVKNTEKSDASGFVQRWYEEYGTGELTPQDLIMLDDPMQPFLPSLGFNPDKNERGQTTQIGTLVRKHFAGRPFQLAAAPGHLDRPGGKHTVWAGTDSRNAACYRLVFTG